MTPRTPAQKKAIEKYEEDQKQISFRMPMEEYEKLKKAMDYFGHKDATNIQIWTAGAQSLISNPKV